MALVGGPRLIMARPESEFLTATSPASAGRLRARALWRRVHLWLALIIGAPLALMGLSGAILILKTPLFKVDFGTKTFAVTPQDRPYATPGAWVANAQGAYPEIERVVSIAGPRHSPIKTDAALLSHRDARSRHLFS